MILVICLLVGKCGKDEGPTQISTPDTTSLDSIPPAAITDLLAKNPTTSSVSLLWTAPGDDGLEGTAESYDIRYYSEPITGTNWPIASQFDGEPAPNTAGQAEMVNINGLDEFTTYFFAVKTTDDAGNTSGLSNSVSETTVHESMKPAAVTDLSAMAVDDYSFLLEWTASGDDGVVGTASEYDIRYSQDPITEETWASAKKVSMLPEPKPAGEPETLLVTQIRASQNHYFALKTADEVPNWSETSNCAFGMGTDVSLTLSSHYISIGEDLKIFYRAPGGTMVMIALAQNAYTGCDPAQGSVEDIILVRTNCPQGVFEVDYNFKPDEGPYLPPGKYYITLCWDGMRKIYSVVYLESS